MSGGLPNDPISDIVATTSPNADLAGAGTFPSLSRITVVDKVGPRAANRQHAAHEQRAETLRAAVNKLIDNSNVVDEVYLRRDSSTQKDSTAGLTDDLNCGDNKVTQMSAGTVAAASKDAVNGDQLYTEQTARAAGDAALSASLASKADTSQIPVIHEYGVGSSTFTAVVNCLVEISACAGGGGGAGDNSGSGGAGAGLHKLLVAMTPGDSIVMTIGAGAAGSGGTNASGGANTQIDVLISSVYQHRILLGGGQGGVYNDGSAGVTALGGSCYVMMDLMTGSLSQWVAVASANASSPGQSTLAGAPQGAGPYVSGGNGTPNSNSGGGNNSHSGGASIFTGSRSGRASIKGAGGAAGANGANGYAGGNGYVVLVVTPR